VAQGTDEIADELWSEYGAGNKPSATGARAADA